MNIHQWIVNNLPTNSVVVEAGTCDGSDTIFFSQYFSNGMVYGFEPIPALYNTVVSRIGHPYNVELVQKALSEKTGKLTIHCSDRFGADWGSSSILEPKDHIQVHPDITFKTQIEVDTVNLDDWFLAKKIDHIDFMWLDMQGYEPVVLKSSPLVLSKTQYLYTEVSLMETYRGVMLYPEYKKFLLDNNFEVVFEDLPWKDMGNVLFRNKAYVK